MPASAPKTADNLDVEELQLVGLAGVEQRSLNPAQLTDTEREAVLRHSAARTPEKGRYASSTATRFGRRTTITQKPGEQPPRQ
jgi:hypothetical protein